MLGWTVIGASAFVIDHSCVGTDAGVSIICVARLWGAVASWKRSTGGAGVVALGVVLDTADWVSY